MPAPQIDWELLAVWAQAVSSTVVLFMIWYQMKQVNTQMIQSDEQEKFRRSWEFVRLYREEVKQDDYSLFELKETFNPLINEPECDQFCKFMTHFYYPRYHLFMLLNQLVQNQEVDERILFGYLEDDFNRFIEMGVRKYGLDDFRSKFGVKIKLLLTLWGSQITSTKLLYGTPPPIPVNTLNDQ